VTSTCKIVLLRFILCDQNFWSVGVSMDCGRLMAMAYLNVVMLYVYASVFTVCQCKFNTLLYVKTGVNSSLLSKCCFVCKV